MAEKKEKKLYSRFAEVGRVALIQYGPDEGKLATIVDIIDQNRVRLRAPSRAGRITDRAARGPRAPSQRAPTSPRQRGAALTPRDPTHPPPPRPSPPVP